MSVLCVAIGTGVLLLSSRAWAPPLCRGGLIVDNQVLNLRLRSVTIDGAVVNLSLSAPPYPFRLQSGCAINALDGNLLDPDAPTTFRAAFWGLAMGTP